MTIELDLVPLSVDHTNDSRMCKNVQSNQDIVVDLEYINSNKSPAVVGPSSVLVHDTKTCKRTAFNQHCSLIVETIADNANDIAKSDFYVVYIQ